MSVLPIIPPATVLVLLGVITALLALPLLFGLVRPNRFYGIRTAAAFASERNWYAINCFGAKRFLYFAATIVTAGLALERYPQSPFWVPILCLVAALALLLLTVRAIDRYARSL